MVGSHCPTFEMEPPIVPVVEVLFFWHMIGVVFICKNIPCSTNFFISIVCNHSSTEKRHLARIGHGFPWIFFSNLFFKLWARWYSFFPGSLPYLWSWGLPFFITYSGVKRRSNVYSMKPRLASFFEEVPARATDDAFTPVWQACFALRLGVRLEQLKHFYVAHVLNCLFWFRTERIVRLVLSQILLKSMSVWVVLNFLNQFSSACTLRMHNRMWYSWNSEVHVHLVQHCLLMTWIVTTDCPDLSQSVSSSTLSLMLSWRERVSQPSGTFSAFVSTTGCPDLSCASSSLGSLLSSDECAWFTLVSTTGLPVLSEETSSSWLELTSISWERDVFLPSCTVLVWAPTTGCPDLSRLGFGIGWFDWKHLDCCTTCPSGRWACSEPNSSFPVVSQGDLWWRPRWHVYFFVHDFSMATFGIQ